MIRIFQPHVIREEAHARLSADVEIDGKRAAVWFRVAGKFGEYLCDERSDAFVIGVLNYAMRNGHDIVCEAPMSEDLLYQIDTYLIDALYKNSRRLHRTRISAQVASAPLPCAGAVGTGISCGIDSLHALACQCDPKYPGHRITHLTFNNVGSHGEGARARRLFEERRIRAERFSREYGFELVEGDSNLMDIVEQDHYLSHTYSSCFAIYALQKLYSVYYYASSGSGYDEFSVRNSERYAPGRYEMLALPLFSTHSLRIYSEGEAIGRLEKTLTVSGFAPSYKYLHVCTESVGNCGRCEKCTRTMLALDALGKLDLYRQVFDVDYYLAHRSEYLLRMLHYYYKGRHDYRELYPALKEEIPLPVRIRLAHEPLKYGTLRLLEKLGGGFSPAFNK